MSACLMYFIRKYSSNLPPKSCFWIFFTHSSSIPNPLVVFQRMAGEIIFCSRKWFYNKIPLHHWYSARKNLNFSNFRFFTTVCKLVSEREGEFWKSFDEQEFIERLILENSKVEFTSLPLFSSPLISKKVVNYKNPHMQNCFSEYWAVTRMLCFCLFLNAFLFYC